ncbi:387_t:CDS:10, partial [Ambispora leptoticha]
SSTIQPKMPLGDSTNAYNTTMVDDYPPIDDPPLSLPTDPSQINDKLASVDSIIIEEEETVEMEGIVGSTSTSNKTKDNLQSNSITEDQDFNNDNDKGKGKENWENVIPLGSDSFNDSTSTLNQDKFKSSSIPFGKQQDVTECMDNVMFQLEAALKPTISDNGVTEVTEKTRNIVKRLESILREDKTIAKVSGSEFRGNEGRDLYNGLDVYFDESQVDFNGTQAEREVTIIELPPILQIQVQRVQFDRVTSNVYKSNAYIKFEKELYLDRYMEQNREMLRGRREIAREWNQLLDQYNQELDEFGIDKTINLPADEILKRTYRFIVTQCENENTDKLEFKDDFFRFKNDSDDLKRRKEVTKNSVSELQDQLKHQYDDLRECEYRIHAVFIHSASFGHYWIYIYDFELERWLKYNDTEVSEVGETEVFADTSGSSTNPYCMVYVRAQGIYSFRLSLEYVSYLLI